MRELVLPSSKNGIRFPATVEMKLQQVAFDHLIVTVLCLS